MGLMKSKVQVWNAIELLNYATSIVGVCILFM